MQLDANVKVGHTIENTNSALAQLNANRQSGVSEHQSVDATDTELQEIIAFLKTLTDPCQRSFMYRKMDTRERNWPR